MRFLTRRDCPLCEHARPVVTRAVARAGAELEELDIDAEENLRETYGARVPVLLGPDDQVIAEGHISNGRALRRAIRRLGTG